jgi:carboxypeptidase PM20D1
MTRSMASDSNSAVLNCRLLPGLSVDVPLDHLHKVIYDSRTSITCTDTSAPSKRPVSIHTSWYHKLEACIAELYPGVPICPMLMIGASDARHYRDICSCVDRFQPVAFQKSEDDRTHGVDERVEIAQLPVTAAFNGRLMQIWSCS